jgi:acyl-CoA thioesterase YciA
MSHPQFFFVTFITGIITREIIKMREKVTSKMCLVQNLGTQGNLFGGNMLAWMDEAAAIYAMQVTGEHRIVSVKFAEIIFKKPVKENDIIDYYCENPKLGNTSITFKISAEVRGKEIFSTECVFVVVDENDRPKAITGVRLN